MALIKNETYPVYKRGAPVASEDLNKSNEITQAALNHIHENLDVIVDDYVNGRLHGITFTPYYEGGYLKWTDVPQEEGPAAFLLHTTVFKPSMSADGTLSWTNDAGYENPAPINLKGPKGDTGGFSGTVPWADVQNKPTTIGGYGITNAYTKAEVDAHVNNIMANFSNLEAAVNSLQTQMATKMANSRMTVSTAAPTGGTDGDIWFKVG